MLHLAPGTQVKPRCGSKPVSFKNLQRHPREKGRDWVCRLSLCSDIELVLKLADANACNLRDRPLAIPRTENRPVLPKGEQVN